MLIIEDDWIVASGLREMLRAEGFRVAGIASRADRVEALLREEAPALALVDINLGRDGDGVELVRELLGPRGVVSVFTSAHADTDTLDRARTVGAAGFLVKPFTQRQLRAAVEIALAQHGADDAPRPAVAEYLEQAHRALAELAQAAGAPPRAASVSVQLRSEPLLDALSDREREVVLGLLAHRRVAAIAAHLDISPHTVRNHLKAIFAKLGVGSQQALLDLVIDRSRDGGGAPRAAGAGAPDEPPAGRRTRAGS